MGRKASWQYLKCKYTIAQSTVWVYLRRSGKGLPDLGMPWYPVFDRSVNPISTRAGRGQIMLTTLLLPPSRIFRPSYSPVIRICVSVVHSGCKCGVFCVFNPPTLSLSVEAAWEMNFWWPRSLHDQRWVIKLRRLFCPSPRWSNAMIATYCICQ